MDIDLLYFAGCPHVDATLDLIDDVLAEQGLHARISRIEIKDGDDAERQRFPGSPTVRVDGVDIDPSQREADRFGMLCRVYRDGAALRGIPPRAMIERAIV
jgi:hypothetical protein